MTKRAPSTGVSSELKWPAAKVQSRPKSKSAPPAKLAVPSASAAVQDEFLSDDRRDALMNHANRVGQSAGTRPPPQLAGSARRVRGADAKSYEVSPGVSLSRILDDKRDPAVSIDAWKLARATRTKAFQLPVDQRVLSMGAGWVESNGKRQKIRAGDIILVPRHEEVRFESPAREPLQLYSVTTPAWRGNRPDVAQAARVEFDAPMQVTSSLLRLDESKEFFVGEGVLILERANSDKDPSVGFDRARAPRGMTTALHTLKIDERHLITSGSGTAEVGGKKFKVRAGDVVLVPRGVPQRIDSDGIEFYCVTTPRFLVEDYQEHLEDARVDARRYDGQAGPIDSVRRKLAGEEE